MHRYGKADWGGQMFDRIEGMVGIDTTTDVLKILDTKLIDMRIKNNLREKKLLEQEKKVASKQKNSVGTGSPRDDAGIEGIDSAESGVGGEQPGTEVETATSPLPELSKSWFVDNFGVEGGHIAELLVKSGKEELAQAIQPLIEAERRSLLKTIPSVSPDLVNQIPFTDFDWTMLRKNIDTLEIPFRRFVKSWNDGQKEIAYETWSNRISKDARLSWVERKILEKARDVLEKNGSMNSHALQTYGVNGSATKIAMLIKSHGFLYDIVALGSGKRSDSKTLFYGLEQSDVFVKDAGALIGSLYDIGGSIEIGSRGQPRMILPFNSKVCKEYASALNENLEINGIIAEGSGLVIEGELSVAKAIELSLPHTNEKSDLILLQKSLISEDNHDAHRCLLYKFASPQEKVSLMKKWGASDEGMEKLLEDVING